MNQSILEPTPSEIDVLSTPALRLGLESHLRPVKTVPVPVVNNSQNLKEKTNYFGAPGTVTVFIGRSSESIRRVRRAAHEGDASVAAIVEESRVGEPAAGEKAFDLVVASPVIATLSYGGKPLVENLLIAEDRDLVGFTLLYSGGRLAPQGFELRQFHQPGAPLYEAVALQTMPELTAAEIAALEQVPDPALWRNVEVLRIDPDKYPSYGVAALVGAVVGGAVGGFVAGYPGLGAGVVFGAFAGAGVYAAYTALSSNGGSDVRKGGAPKLSEEDLHRLGSEGTALDLLELRRVALLRSAAD